MTNEIDSGVHNDLVFKALPYPIPLPIFGWPWFQGLAGVACDLAKRELGAYGVKVTVAGSGVDISYKGNTVDLTKFSFDAKTGTVDADVSVDGFSAGDVALFRFNGDGAITLTKTTANIIDMIAGRDIVSDHTVINLGELLWGLGPWGWPVGVVSPPAVHPEPIVDPAPIFVSMPILISPPIMRVSPIIATAEIAGGAKSADGAAAAPHRAEFGGSRIASSSADGFSGALTVNRHTTTIASFDRVFGAAPPAYDDRRKVASFEKTYNLSGSDRNYVSLQAQGKHIVDVAHSGGLGVDAIAASGSARLGSADFVLTDNPLSTLSILELSVEATGIHSESNSSFVFGPDKGSLTGDASFHSLTIGGALVDGKTLTFSGDAKANTVLYSSSTVTITLDRQTFLLPPVGAGVIGPSITTDAIDIVLNNAAFGGHTISGNFVIGQSTAGYELTRA